MQASNISQPLYPYPIKEHISSSHLHQYNLNTPSHLNLLNKFNSLQQVIKLNFNLKVCHPNDIYNTVSTYLTCFKSIETELPSLIKNFFTQEEARMHERLREIDLILTKSAENNMFSTDQSELYFDDRMIDKLQISIDALISGVSKGLGDLYGKLREVLGCLSVDDMDLESRRISEFRKEISNLNAEIVELSSVNEIQAIEISKLYHIQDSINSLKQTLNDEIKLSKQKRQEKCRYQKELNIRQDRKQEINRCLDEIYHLNFELKLRDEQICIKDKQISLLNLHIESMARQFESNKNGGSSTEIEMSNEGEIDYI